MTICLPPGAPLGDIPAGGVIADSDWPDDDDGFAPISFAPKTVNGRIRIRLADLVKLGGPEGYIHGYICVRPPCGPAHEAEFNGRLGEVRHDGVRIGKMRKNADGTYSMAHIGGAGRVKLAARYATRADAAKSIALYHNVDKLHDEAADPEVKAALAKARAALGAGDDGTATMYMAQAETKAFAKGDMRLETHIRDTRAAIVDGPKAVSPPDVAGLLDTGGMVPAPRLPAKHAPLSGDVKRAAKMALFEVNFGIHNQRVKDRFASAHVAINAGDGDMAVKHLASAYDEAFAADDRDGMEHAVAAHNIIAAHLGLPPLKAEETAVSEAPVPLPAPEPPAAPKVRKLPKAKAAVIGAELDAAQNGTGIKYAQAYQTIHRARDAIAAGDLNDAHELLAEAHESLAGNPIASPARDHIAMADEQLAAHLKVAPFQARTITHANDHALPIAAAARGIVAVGTQMPRGGIVAVGTQMPRGGRLDYLVSEDGVMSRLRDGDAGQVIRDLRELAARAKDNRDFELRSDRKAAISDARKTANAVKRNIEVLHKRDLSDQSFSDRAAKLASDIAPYDGGYRPAAVSLQNAVTAINGGDLGEAIAHLDRAASAAASAPRRDPKRQFEEDITNLRAGVSEAHQAKLLAGLREETPEPVTGTGFLADTQNERNRVRAQLADAVRSGTASKKSPTVKGVMGETNIVKFHDGSTWIHKTPRSGEEDESDKEELASLVARAVGARAPTVVRDPLDSKSVYMTLVDGKTAFEAKETADKIINRGGDRADAMRKIGFMDYLIKNLDRHGGNWMVGQDQMPVAIDHGNAWGYNNGSSVTQLVHKADFSPEYYAQVKENLAALEFEFMKTRATRAAGAKKFNATMSQLKKWMAWEDNGHNRPDG